MSVNYAPVLGFAGFSGSGKTTLLEQLIPHLKAAGLRVGVLKHSHHTIDPDKPGKDSYRLRYAGSEQLLLATSHRHVLFFEYGDDDNREPDLKECLLQLDHSRLDLVLVEGFRDETLAKIEVHRPAYGKPLLCRHDSNIIALATDQPPTSLCSPLPTMLDLNQPQEVASFVLNWLQHGPRAQQQLAYQQIG